jgi:hypothetical protein
MTENVSAQGRLLEQTLFEVKKVTVGQDRLIEAVPLPVIAPAQEQFGPGLPVAA